MDGMDGYLLLWKTVLDMKGFVVGFRFVGLVYQLERYVCVCMLDAYSVLYHLP